MQDDDTLKSDSLLDEAQQAQDADVNPPIDWRRRYEAALESKVAAERQLLEVYLEIRDRESELEAANQRLAVIPDMELEIQQVSARHASLNNLTFIPLWLSSSKTDSTTLKSPPIGQSRPSSQLPSQMLSSKLIPSLH